VEADVAEATRGEGGSASCYLASTQADLVSGASKLSGSAQVWDGDAVLQHGSFAVSRDVALEAALLRLSPDQQERLAESTCTLSGLSGGRPPVAQIEEAIVDGFEEMLGLSLEPGAYTDLELQTAQDLYQRFTVSGA
jgi:lipoate-protein ligase A